MATILVYPGGDVKSVGARLQSETMTQSYRTTYFAFFAI
jgi:hypothetical protein